MTSLDGIIRVVHECHCFKCERPQMGLNHRKSVARAELVGLGWRQIGRKWHCSFCVEDIATMKRAILLAEIEAIGLEPIEKH